MINLATIIGEELNNFYTTLTLFLLRMTPSPASSSYEPPIKQTKLSTTPKKERKIKEVGLNIVTVDTDERDVEKIQKNEKRKQLFT